MAWSDDNTVCTIIYSLLTGKLEQMDQSVLFPAAGMVAMSQLTYFNATASPDVIKLAATGLATTLDSTFTNAYLAGYANGKTQAQAINGLVTILVNGQSTVSNLSDTVSSFYQFIS
jgi:hypothetical protein